jgi:hypothetical protein
MLILFLQLLAFALLIGYFARLNLAHILGYSLIAYGSSLLILTIAILSGLKGAMFNCVSVLMILLNMLLYVTILFTSYLGDFLSGVKG